MTDIKNSEEVK